MMWDLVAVGSVCALIGRQLGFREGVKAENLRVLHAFDVAMRIVASGALGIVRRRIANKLTDDELREQLRQEADYRAQARAERVERASVGRP